MTHLLLFTPDAQHASHISGILPRRRLAGRGLHLHLASQRCAGGVVGYGGADLVEVRAVGSGAYSGWRGRKTLGQGLPLSAAGERHDAYLC